MNSPSCHRTFHLQRRLPALICAALSLAVMPAVFAANPAPPDGAQLYRQHCASCHGKGGEGDGPVAPFFKLLPPDLTLIARRSGGTFPAERVHRIIDGREIVAPHGAREMTVWGLAFSMNADDPVAGNAAAEASITRLVEYLRSIQKPPRR